MPYFNLISRVRSAVPLSMAMYAACAALPIRLAFGGDADAALQQAATEHLEIVQPPEVLPPVVSDTRLSLETLQQMALASNPSIARAQAMVGAARGNWVQVGLPPNPIAGYEGQQIGSGGLAEQHGVLFGQEIVRGGKLKLNRDVAQGDVLVAEQELEAQRQRVLTDVRIAFFHVLIAERQMDLGNELIRISSEGIRTVEDLLKAKEVGRTDSLQAQLEAENARILAENANNRYAAAWQNLAAVAGNPALAKQPLNGDALAPPQEIEYQQALARLQAASPEIAAAALRVDRARAALQRSRVEPVPNVNFQGLVNLQDNGIGGKPDGGVMVTLPVPIFNRNQGAIRQAQQELTAASRAFDQVELDLQNRLSPVYEQYANARNQVNRYRQTILPAANEALRLSRSTYQVGEANYLALLTAQRTYSQTAWNYLEAVRVLRTAEAEIDGFLLRDSLATAGTPGVSPR